MKYAVEMGSGAMYAYKFHNGCFRRSKVYEAGCTETQTQRAR
jgi:hypothetical protein